MYGTFRSFFVSSMAPSTLNNSQRSFLCFLIAGKQTFDIKANTTPVEGVHILNKGNGNISEWFTLSFRAILSGV